MSRPPRHFLAQVHWRNVLAWREDPASEGPSGEVVGPRVYGSNQPILATLRENDVLWKVTFPKYGRYLQPPSLLARLTVRPPQADDVVPDVSLYDNVIFGAPDSPYFPINNALGALRRAGQLPEAHSCKHCRELQSKHKGTYTGLPNHLLSARELPPHAADVLTTYSHAVTQGHRVFLSYRRDDDRLAPAVGRALEAAGLSCWWDRWMIDDLHGHEHLDAKLLRDILDDGVRQACWFVAFVGSTWQQSKWTAQEWSRAQAEVGRTRRDVMEVLPVWRCAEARTFALKGTRPPLDLVGLDDPDAIAQKVLAAIGVEGVSAASSTDTHRH